MQSSHPTRLTYLSLCLALLGNFIPLAGWAQTTTVTVEAATTVRIVDERVFGVNATMWDDQVSTDQTISLVRDAGIRIIRIPGGSQSNQYRWLTNRRFDVTDWQWGAGGVSGFAKLITGAEAQAFVSVNYGTGTPEEAAAWVAYANASPSSEVAIGVDSKGVDWRTAGHWASIRAASPLAQDDGMNFLRMGRSTSLGFKYWEIGNENYGSWEVDQQAVPLDPYTYGVRAKDYIAKMKAVDPTIKVGIVVITGNQYANNTNHPATNPRTGAVQNGWTPVLLNTLKSLATTPDFAVFHRYDQAPSQESDAFLLQSSRTWPDDAADLRQQLTDYLGTTEGAKVELVVTENNSVYADPGKQSVSLVNGLFLADSVGNLLQTEFNALTWWALRNGPPEPAKNMSTSLYGWRMYGDYGILSRDSTRGNYDPHPTYYAMKLLTHFARGGDAVVRATSNDTLLAVYAVRRTDRSLSLLVINKSPSATKTANFALTGHLPAATANVYSYGIPQDEAARTGTGSRDIATGTLDISGASFSASFAPYSLTVISLSGLPGHTSASLGGTATLTAATSGTNPAATYQWQMNGVDLPAAATPTYTITNAQSANAGLYTAVVTSGTAVTADPAIVGLASTAKVVGFANEAYPDILHANGNIYDQILLEGAAATITADANQIVRMSYIDRNDDIVQVEFAGAGSLSLLLDEPSGKALPVKYNQNIEYVKGHAGIVITGADETTNVTVFAVGRYFSTNPTLFKEGETYDGRADLSYLAIHTTNGKFGGVRTGNVRYSGAKGTVGVYAPGVQFTGPVVVGDIDATGTAMPTLMIGSGSDVRVAGGDFKQADDRAIKVSGFTQLRFTANIDSHSNPLPAQTNQGRLVTNGMDVTTKVVVNP